MLSTVNLTDFWCHSQSLLILETLVQDLKEQKQEISLQCYLWKSCISPGNDSKRKVLTRMAEQKEILK